MAILGLLAAAAPFIATPVVETFAGWLFLTGGFVGLAALFTTRNVPGFVWTLLSAVLAILIGAFLVWRPFAGLVTLTVALAAFFAVHGIVQILTALDHRALFTQSWLWMAVSGIADLILAGIIIAGWLARERGLGARPAHRHQSLHVRLGAGDDRDCVPKRQRRVREGSAGGPHDLTMAVCRNVGRRFWKDRHFIFSGDALLNRPARVVATRIETNERIAQGDRNRRSHCVREA